MKNIKSKAFMGGSTSVCFASSSIKSQVSNKDAKKYLMQKFPNQKYKKILDAKGKFE